MMSIHSISFRRILAGFACAVALPLLGGCSGFLTKAEDPQEVGRRLYAEKNYSEAAGAFRMAVKQDPRDYRAQYNLGTACDADGRPLEAIEAYGSALDVMAITYEGQADGAFRLTVLDALAQSIARSDPRDTQLNLRERKAKQTQKAEDFFLLAKIYRYRGDPDGALANYQHAALLDNKYFPVLKEYGLYLQQVGQVQPATAMLAQAYRVNDKDAQVAGALRQLGVIPGPSLKEKDELAQPIVPKGPIPPLDLSKIGLGGSSDNTPAPLPQPAAPASSLQAPRE